MFILTNNTIYDTKQFNSLLSSENRSNIKLKIFIFFIKPYWFHIIFNILINISINYILNDEFTELVKLVSEANKESTDISAKVIDRLKKTILMIILFFSLIVISNYHSFYLKNMERNIKLLMFEKLQKSNNQDIKIDHLYDVSNMGSQITRIVTSLVQIVQALIFITLYLGYLCIGKKQKDQYKGNWKVCGLAIVNTAAIQILIAILANTLKPEKSNLNNIIIEIFQNRKTNTIFEAYSENLKRVKIADVDQHIQDKKSSNHISKILIAVFLLIIFTNIGLMGLLLYFLYYKHKKYADILEIIILLLYLIVEISTLNRSIGKMLQDGGELNNLLSQLLEIHIKNDNNQYEIESIGEIEEIEFKNIGYKRGEKEIISGINGKIKKGEIVCLIGESGCGKTTILEILTGLIDKYDGEILVNGIELRKYKKEAIRKQIGYITQSSELFNISIRDNFTIINPNITDNEIIKILEQVNLGDLVKERSLDFIVGSNGSNLSGGQAQRLSVAKCLSRPCSLYLLDEVTSSLDPINSRAILQILLSIITNKISIFVDHSMLVPPVSDSIVFFDNRSVYFNNHSSLLSDNIKYKSLFDKLHK